MSILIILASILLPVLMIIARVAKPNIQITYQVLALIATLVFANISALAVYEIIRDQTVFMTNIHALFLNPFFLLTGSYLGIFAIYTMLAGLLQR